MKRMYRCRHCGSGKMVWRGYFIWDDAAQAFEVTGSENDAYCENCDRQAEPIVVHGYGAVRKTAEFISDVEIDVACLLDNCDDDLRPELEALQTKLTKFAQSLGREG